MPKVTIVLDVELAPAWASADLKTVIECWLHGIADSENEALDPNTSEVVGYFSFSSDEGFKVHVTP